MERDHSFSARIWPLGAESLAGDGRRTQTILVSPCCGSAGRIGGLGTAHRIDLLVLRHTLH